MIEGSFCAAVGFQYQRGPGIGILIRGGVSNKGEPSVKYGVQLRHTTTAISKGIKKAAQTKKAASTGQRAVHRRVTGDTEGRETQRDRDSQREREDLLVNGRQGKSSTEMARKINSDRANC